MAVAIKTAFMTDDDKRRLWLVDLYIFVRNQNPLFCTEIEDARANPHDTQKREKFKARWGIYPEFDNIAGCYFNDVVDELPGQDDMPHLLNLAIDLRYSKTQIIKKLEKMVAYYQDHGNFPRLQIKKGKIGKGLEEYTNAIHVWRMKEIAGWKWPEIQATLGVEKKYENPYETVRNWYYAIKKLIRNGVPGFPPFPTKPSAEQPESTTPHN